MASDSAWPELPVRDWQPTRDTLILWLQVKGKIRILAPGYSSRPPRGLAHDGSRISSARSAARAVTPSRTPHEFFSGHPFAVAVFENVREIVDRLGPVEVRVSKSQVAFRLRRGFAYLWIPGRYLRKPTAEVVLSIALGRRDASPRFKEVAHPTPAEWMHHLEIHQLGDLDDEVANWLREAAERAR